MTFIESVWSGIKMGSVAMAVLALVLTFSLGVGVTYELFAGHTPEICKIGGKHVE